MRPSSLAHESQAGKPGQVSLRPPIATFAIFTSTSRTLADVLADPGLSDRAKRVAHYLDGCCRAWGRWLAWPKVSTIADVLGWTAEYGARKRIERAFQELTLSGDVERLTVRQLWEWIDSRGPSSGLETPSRLPRHLRQNQKVCVLGWKLREARQELPKPPQCDTTVPLATDPDPVPTPPSVAYMGTNLSHGNETLVSHSSLNVRSLNCESEQTSDDDGLAFALSEEPEEPPTMGDPAPSLETWNRAQRIATKIRDLRWTVDFDGNLEVMPLFVGRTSEVPTDEHRAEVAKYLPEIRAILWPKSVAPTKASESSPIVAAPRVDPQIAAEIRFRLKVLPLEAPRSLSEAMSLALLLAKVLGPHADEAETLKTFTRYARTLPVSWLVDAFESACGPKRRNRGASFVKAIKRFKEASMSRERSPAL